GSGGPGIHPLKAPDRLWRKIMVGDDMNQLAIEPVHRTHVCVAETHSVDDDRVEYGLQVEGRTAENFEDFSGGRLLLARLVELMRAEVELLLQFDWRCWCGQRFAGLGPTRALPLLTAFTTSLHVAPGRFTTIINSMQFLVAAPCPLSFKERSPARPRHTITGAPETIRTSDLCRRSFHARSKRAKSGPLPLGGLSSIEGLRAPVAQLGRALPSEGKGRSFESSGARPRHGLCDRPH